MIQKFKKLESKLIHKAHIFDFYEEKVQLPNGKIDYYDVLKHKGAAAVIPVLPDGRILMVKQYRNALDRITVEIPAGGINVGETAIQAAYRELEEEAGYRTDHLEHIISIRTAVAFCNELIEVYIANNLIPSSQNLDEDEFIEVEAYELKELMNMIFVGTIEDSKTISSIMSYHAFLEKQSHNIE